MAGDFLFVTTLTNPQFLNSELVADLLLVFS